MSPHQLLHDLCLNLRLTLLETNPRLHETGVALTVGDIIISTTGDKHDFKLASVEFVADDYLVSVPLKRGA